MRIATVGGFSQGCPATFRFVLFLLGAPMIRDPGADWTELQEHDGRKCHEGRGGFQGEKVQKI